MTAKPWAIIIAYFNSKQLIFFLLIFYPLALFASADIAESHYRKIEDALQEKSDIIKKHPLQPTTYIEMPFQADTAQINKKISYFNTVFLRNISLNRVYLYKPVIIKLSNFKDSIYLDKVKAYQNVRISWNFFEKKVETYRIYLEKKAFFKSNIFSDKAVFYKIQCYSICDFSLSTFHNQADFTGALFKDKAIFNSIYFDKNVTFQNASFNETATFIQSTFNKTVDFNLAEFNQGLNLSHAKFKGHVNLQNTTINGILDLSHIQIMNGILDLSSIIPANQKEKVPLNIVETNINKLHFSYENFRLYFPETVNYRQKEYIYTQLLQHFKKNGQTKSYEILFKEFHRVKYRHEQQYIRDIIFRNFWDYGLNPHKALYWLGILFLIYTVINAAFYLKLTKEYCIVAFLEKVDTSYAEKLNPLMRFIYFLPHAFILTLFIFAGTFLRFGNVTSTVQSRNIFTIAYLLLITITGYLALFYILAIILSGGRHV